MNSMTFSYTMLMWFGFAFLENKQLKIKKKTRSSRPVFVKFATVDIRYDLTIAFLLLRFFS